MEIIRENRIIDFRMPTLMSDFRFKCLGLETTSIILCSNVRQKGVKNLVYCVETDLENH